MISYALWIPAALLAGSAGWALAEALLFRPRHRGSSHGGTYCSYCGWGLSRVSGYEVYRWEGQAYCSLVCLRLDGALRQRERETE